MNNGQDFSQPPFSVSPPSQGSEGKPGGSTSGVIRLQYINESKVTDSRTLRRTMTSAEMQLWLQLRGRKVGNMKFRRQQIIEGFIADFYCEEGKICIEVDGGIHETPEQAAIDEHRTRIFNARGIRVIRFSNDEVLSDLPAVIAKILLFSKQ
jgi:very-short-patch-repair endonuclease